MSDSQKQQQQRQQQHQRQQHQRQQQQQRQQQHQRQQQQQRQQQDSEIPEEELNACEREQRRQRREDQRWERQRPDQTAQQFAERAMSTRISANQEPVVMPAGHPSCDLRTRHPASLRNIIASAVRLCELEVERSETTSLPDFIKERNVDILPGISEETIEIDLIDDTPEYFFQVVLLMAENVWERFRVQVRGQTEDITRYVFTRAGTFIKGKLARVGNYYMIQDDLTRDLLKKIATVFHVSFVYGVPLNVPLSYGAVYAIQHYEEDLAYVELPVLIYLYSHDDIDDLNSLLKTVEDPKARDLNIPATKSVPVTEENVLELLRRYISYKLFGSYHKAQEIGHVIGYSFNISLPTLAAFFNDELHMMKKGTVLVDKRRKKPALYKRSKKPVLYKPVLIDKRTALYKRTASNLIVDLNNPAIYVPFRDTGYNLNALDLLPISQQVKYFNAAIEILERKNPTDNIAFATCIRNHFLSQPVQVNYIDGVNYLSIMTNGDKIIYIFADRTHTYEGICSPINVSTQITDYLDTIFRSTDRFIDCYGEMPFIHTNYDKAPMIDTMNRFRACTERSEYYCAANVRFHMADARVSKDYNIRLLHDNNTYYEFKEVTEIMSFRPKYEKWVKQHLKTNTLVRKELSRLEPTFAQHLLFQVLDHNWTIIAQTQERRRTILETMHKAWPDWIQTVREIHGSGYYMVFAYLETFIMDLYLLARVFKKYKSVYEPTEAKNIIIFAGSAHTNVYKATLASLGFKITNEFHSSNNINALERDKVSCLQVDGLTMFTREI